MQLTGPEILRRMQIKNKNNPDAKPDIIIKPFNEKCLGSNSYDLHLGNLLKIYRKTLPRGMNPIIPYCPGKMYSMRDWFNNYDSYLDFIARPWEFDIRNPQYILDPCDTTSHETIDIEIPKNGGILSPMIGYLGHTVEYTETYNGFCGQWTLEIRTLYPTVVYPNMRIGQIYYEEFTGERKPYNQNTTSHYNGQMGPTPAAIIPIENIKQKQR